MAKMQEKEQIRLLLVGKTGSGKSSSGNTILGAKHFNTSSSYASSTLDCTVRSAVVLRTPVLVMDTPGLLDTEISDVDTGIVIVKAVINMHPGPNAIIYVIGPEKYVDNDFEAYERFKKMFGAEVVDQLIILFTYGDRLLEEKITIDAKLETAPSKLKQVVQECGDRYVVFNNKSQAMEQVQSLLDKVFELGKKNNHKPYTLSNYSAVGDAVERKVKQRLQEVNETEAKKMDELRIQEKKMQAGFKELEQEKEQLQKEKEHIQKEKQKDEEEIKKKADHNEKQRQELDERKKKIKRQESKIKANDIADGLAKVVGDVAKLCVKAYHSAQDDDSDSRRVPRGRRRQTQRGFHRSPDGSESEDADDIPTGVERVWDKSSSRRCRGTDRKSPINWS